MRILFLNGHPVWRNGLPWGLRQLGHDVQIVEVIQQHDLMCRMQAFQPDLLLTVGWIDQYTPDKLPIIKEAAERFRCLHAYWDTESANYLEIWSLPMVRATRPDVVFTINADCIPYYRDLGMPAFHMQFGYSPAFYSGNTETDPRHVHDMSLVANAYDIFTNPQSPVAFRRKSMDILLRPLLEAGYDVALWGEGWEVASRSWPGATVLDFPGAVPLGPGRQYLTRRRAGRIIASRTFASAASFPNHVRSMGAIPFSETFHVFKSAKIVLNPQNVNSFASQITSRTMEILGCGGFQLTVRTPGVERLFTHGRHLVTSGSPAETKALVDYYLAHEGERLAIAANGQAEVWSKHTYDRRAAYMLSCLGEDSVKKRKKSTWIC